MMEKIYIIGIGLIGGSFALDIKRLHPETKIFGIDHNEAHLKEALSLNIIAPLAVIVALLNVKSAKSVNAVVPEVVGVTLVNAAPLAV